MVELHFWQIRLQLALDPIRLLPLIQACQSVQAHDPAPLLTATTATTAKQNKTTNVIYIITSTINANSVATTARRMENIVESYSPPEVRMGRDEGGNVNVKVRSLNGNTRALRGGDWVASSYGNVTWLWLGNMESTTRVTV